MPRNFATCAFLCANLFAPFILTAADTAADFAAKAVPFLKKYCIDCHGGEKPSAELSLDGFRDSASVVRQRKVWDNVQRMLARGEMPPKDETRPSIAEVDAFTAHIRSVFDYADRNAKPDPGRVTMRRLNKTEYRNTVRDLLLADFDPTEGFPADGVGHGFDNIGDVLSISPLLMERYMDAAETIANRVILVDLPKPARRYLKGIYLRPGGAKVPQKTFRPMDPTSDEPYLSGPFTAPGGYLKLTADEDLYFRATLYAEPQSDAPVKVALFLVGSLDEVSTEEEVGTLMGAGLANIKQMKILKTYEITARDEKNPQEIEFLIKHVAGVSNAGIAVVKPPAGKSPPKLHVRHLWTEGPLETRPKSQLKILACSPKKPQAEQTRQVITRLLRGAYRRTPTDPEVGRLIKLVESTQAEGLKWEAGIQRAIMATLCSPKFLFRVELDDRPQRPETTLLDEFQLASRLSYFLWSSMPDDELLDLAEKKQLAANLDSQVQRMLASPKSSELVRNFALQWLQVQRLERISPDAKLFPTFTPKLRQAMLTETQMFFESVMREDRSILDLLDADYTFVDQALAKHYGIADTNGNWIGQKPVEEKGSAIPRTGFVRVSLQGRRRGGLLTQASVLTVTSNPTRTSPVKRGRWVLEQILGTPPPPPPPNVPELAEDEKTVATGSLRQRMEIHRKKPSCANCHAKMDPIGFALENFDAIGAYRTKDGEFEIEPGGEFSDGTKFGGLDKFKSAISGKRAEFARCLAEKMLIYALGRGLEYYDRPTVLKIEKALAANDYRFSTLVTEIVKSDPFRKRRGSEK